jgi:hypothetical protein
MLVHTRLSPVRKRLPAQTPMLLQEELQQQSCRADLALTLGPHLQSLNYQKQDRGSGPRWTLLCPQAHLGLATVV